jgi:hypothetical protein
MKKHEKKLHLNRETVRLLDQRQLSREDLAKANGGVVWTGCMSDCTECGGTFTVFTQQDVTN